MSATEFLSAARNIARRMGLEVKGSNLYSREDLRLLTMLSAQKIGMVVDIGANRGQFAQGLIDTGYQGKIVSFEAIPSVRKELIANAARYSDRWTVGPCCALGEAPGEAQFHIRKSDATSSLLKPSSYGEGLTESLSEHETIDVRVEPLDKVFDHDPADDNFLLKIDVQGAEASVLAGAKQTLSLATGVLMEMSLTEIYAGQSLAQDLHQYMLDNGLALWDQNSVFRDPQSGRLLQYDGLYFRSSDNG